jgi:ABC-type glycerol-3-phosphate transport system substrate-binding protein
VNPGSLQVVAHSGQRDIAWQWVHFVTSLVDNQLELARVCGSMPASRDAMVRYARLGAIKLPDNWHALIDTASDPNGYPAYVVPQATQIDAAVNPVMSQIWAGRLAPAVGLEQIHKVVTGLLK